LRCKKLYNSWKRRKTLRKLLEAVDGNDNVWKENVYNIREKTHLKSNREKSYHELSRERKEMVQVIVENGSRLVSNLS